MKKTKNFGLIRALALPHTVVKKKRHKNAKNGETLGDEMEKSGRDLAAADKTEEIEEQIKDAEEKTKKFFSRERNRKVKGG